MTAGTTPLPSLPLRPLQPQQTYTEILVTGSKNGFASPVTSSSLRDHSAVPWYKQRKWVIVLVVGFLVCVAAIVGGAVGGTAGHGGHSNSNRTLSDGSNNSTGIGSDQSNSSISAAPSSPDIGSDQSNSSISVTPSSTDPASDIAQKPPFSRPTPPAVGPTTTDQP